MNNSDIAKLLRNVSVAMIIKKENRFRIAAYEKAADSVEHLTSEVKDLWDDGKLTEIPGVGTFIAQHLDELFQTGKVKHFQQIFKGLSPAIFILLEVPGIGPKRASRLTKEFGINEPKTAVDKLEEIAKTGKIAKLPGWGEKSQEEVLTAIESYRKGQIKEKRMVLLFADHLAWEIMDYLKKCSEVDRIDMLGSLRRKVATIGDIDLAVASNHPKKVIEALIKYPQVQKIIDQGEKGATVLLKIGRQVDLRVQTPQAYGAMLQYFTGSKNHNIHLREYALRQGLSLSEYGIKKTDKGSKIEDLRIKNLNKINDTYEYPTEENFYQALGMEWIPPELREDTGEIEASFNHKLPKLVKLSDIKSDLHIHTNYDLKSSHDLGVSNLEEILDIALDLNYEYIGISDHNPKASEQTKDEINMIMMRRKENYEHIYKSWTKSVQKTDLPAGRHVNLLIMLEVDIDPQGKLALPEKSFEYVDAVIVSVHSSFRQTKEQMTQRILKALAFPKAKILGHPTGRLLNKREGYEADWGEIFKYCLENNKAIEINAFPDRLDLPDVLVRDAVKLGVKLIINTDSHDKEHMVLMTYGVDVARRGWAEKKDILNTMEYNDFIRWIKS